LISAYDDGNTSRLGFPMMIVLGSIRVIYYLNREHYTILQVANSTKEEGKWLMEKGFPAI
jgi:hypothetical protein